MERQHWFACGAIVPLLALGACATQPNSKPPANTVTPSPPGTNREPVTLQRVPPFYPAIAQLEGIEGDVTVCFTVEADGALADLRVTHVAFQRAKPVIPGSTYNKAFDRATQEALKAESVYTVTHWKYEPGHKDGKAVKTSGTCQVIKYRLNG